MLILHASILDDFIYLWGESSEETEDKILFVSKKQKKSFPFDAGHKRLLYSLQTISSQIKLEKTSYMILWSPSCQGQALVSSSLIEQGTDKAGKITLLPFHISTAVLSIESFLKLLPYFLGKSKFGPGFLLGNDIHYWTWAMRFAQSLLQKQHFLPSLSKKEEEYYARWKPLYLGEDQETLALLAKKMPGVCRSITETNEEKAPCKPSEDLLCHFIENACDFYLRSQVQGNRENPRKKTSSLHEQWIEALLAPSGKMQGRSEELACFAEILESWQKPVFLTANTPFRLCLRLEEPEEAKRERSQEIWKLRYFLQDTKDPSLLIPASHAWQAQEKKASLLKRDNFQPKEYLFSSLGEVAKVWPAMQKSLKSWYPESLDLQTPEAYRFLSEIAWILKQMGFSILLPSWWTGKKTINKLSAKAELLEPFLQDKSKFSLDQLVDVQWQIALGEESLSLKELKELAQMKSSLVKFRGKWIHVDAKEIQEAINLWKKHDKMTMRDCVQLSLGMRDQDYGLDFAGIETKGEVKNFLDRLQSPESLETLEASKEFTGTLRPYQKRGYAWLEFLSRFGLGSCLADDMGLGKTIQTLALLIHWKEKGKNRPSLLICPTSVSSNWIKEAQRFTPTLKVLLHHGIQRKKGNSFLLEIEKCDLVVSSYALLYRDIDVFQKVDWLGLILDEAQNIKNPKTKQAHAARSLRAECRIALTGTPVENNIGELWSLMEFLNPGFMGSEAEFQQRFFLPIQFHHNPKAIQDLKRLTGPFLLRRLKTDKNIIQDLPEKIETKVYCKLTREQASLYEAVLQDTMEKIEKADGIERKGIIFSAIMKLKQICNHPLQFLKDNSSIAHRSGKLLRLEEILEEILAGQGKCLLFTQFVEMGDILKRHLQENLGEEILFLHGQVERKKRQAIIDAFQEERGPRLFILSLKAGGTGLNLTRASHVIHYDRWWNPSVENQATDRAFRIGQIQNVQVHKFLCSGTMEEKIDNMIDEKKEIAQNVIGSGEAWLTEMSTKQIKEILALTDSCDLCQLKSF